MAATAFPIITAAHEDLVVQAGNWSNWLVELVSGIAAALEHPNYNLDWKSVVADLPSGWGAAFSDPGSLPAVSYEDIVQGSPARPTLAEMPALPDSAVYVAELADAILVRIREVLDGAPLVPDSLFDGMYDQAKDDLAETFLVDSWKADMAFGMRGELPTEGCLIAHDAALSEYRKGLQKALLDAREKQASVRREDMWQGVAQGQALDKLKGEFYYRGREYQFARIRAAIERNKALLEEFSTVWAGVKIHAETVTAAAQAAAAPGEFRIKVEQARAQVEEMLGKRQVEDAKALQGKVVADVRLVESQLQQASRVTAAMQDTIAHIAGAITGAYLSASPTTLTGSASDALVTAQSTNNSRHNSTASVTTTSTTTSVATVDVTSESTITKT